MTSKESIIKKLRLRDENMYLEDYFSFPTNNIILFCEQNDYLYSGTYL